MPASSGTQCGPIPKPELPARRDIPRACSIQSRPTFFQVLDLNGNKCKGDQKRKNIGRRSGIEKSHQTKGFGQEQHQRKLEQQIPADGDDDGLDRFSQGLQEYPGDLLETGEGNETEIHPEAKHGKFGIGWALVSENADDDLGTALEQSGSHNAHRHSQPGYQVEGGLYPLIIPAE